MAKDKSQKQKQKQPNRHLQARIDFLHRAATYLAVQSRDAQSLSAVQADDHDRQIGPPVHSNVIIFNRSHIPSVAVTAPHALADESHMTRPEGGAEAENGLLFRLPSHLWQVAHKAKIRLPAAMKHSICRRCQCLIAASGQTDRSAPHLQTRRVYTTNGSRMGRKAHADVRVEECRVCGAARFFPVGAARQTKKALRRGSAPIGDPGPHAAAEDAGPGGRLAP